MALRRNRPPAQTILERHDKELRELTEKVRYYQDRLEALDRTVALLPGRVDQQFERYGKALGELMASYDAAKSTPNPVEKPAPAKKAAANNRVYTADEIALAVMLKEQGASHAAIGAVLKRSPKSIQALFRRIRQGDPGVGQPRRKRVK